MNQVAPKYLYCCADLAEALTCYRAQESLSAVNVGANPRLGVGLGLGLGPFSSWNSQQLHHLVQKSFIVFKYLLFRSNVVISCTREGARRASRRVCKEGSCCC